MIDILEKSTGLDRSTIINLLPFILIEIRNYTNQYFLTLNHNKVIKIENKKIYSANNLSASGDSTFPLSVFETVFIFSAIFSISGVQTKLSITYFSPLEKSPFI